MATYPEHIWEKAGQPGLPIDVAALQRAIAEREKVVADATLEVVVMYLWNHSPEEGEPIDLYRQRMINGFEAMRRSLAITTLTPG